MSFFHWFLQRRRREQELDEEIQFHLIQAARDRGTAAPNFGNVALVKEVTRDMWGWTRLERLQQDLVYGLRALRRSPVFALTAILSLALGIGANTASFSLADALLLRPIAAQNPSELVQITGSSEQDAFDELPYVELQEIRARSRAFSSVAGYHLFGLGVARTASDIAQWKMGAVVTDGFFQTLGIQPILGRAFRDDETVTPDREPVVVVSHEFWRTQLGSDPHAAGTTLRLNGIPFTIVGVTPESFTGMDPFIRPALYFPITMSGRLSNRSGAGALQDRSARTLLLRGRLKPGATIEQARSELDALAVHLAREYPDTNRGVRYAVRTEFHARVEQFPPLVAAMALLMTLSCLVLLVASANVANLLLARARARSREIAIRLAIGAGRARLFQQLVTESVLLALLGGLAGLLLAQGAIRYLTSIQLPTDTPIAISAQLDWRVLLFSLFVSVASAVLFGIVPAWQSTKLEVSPTLKSGETGAPQKAGTLGRQFLVGAQVAASLVLLVAFGSFLDAFRQMMITDPGIRTDHLMMVEFDPSLLRYSTAQTTVFYRRLTDEVRRLPGVRSAALSRGVPFRPNFSDEGIIPEGMPLPAGKTTLPSGANMVSEDYFPTIGTVILRGRALDLRDTADSPRVAVVNQEFARRYFPNQEPLGKRFRLGPKGDFLQVVGIAKTAKYLSLTETPQPYFYMPLSQAPRSRLTLFVQTYGAANEIAGPVLRTARNIDPNQPVFNTRPMEVFYQLGVLGPSLIVVQMVSVTGLVGLALALVGLYGLIAYSVVRRTREIGIRVAIGASRTRILWMILGQGLRITIVGAAAGLALSIPLFRLLSSALAGLGPLSPWTLAAVPLGLIIITTAACALPAFRASAIDPLNALRNE
ncbi:ABC transporter permease [uncultured Paludibaculum sp.]|uniref:ABC transporter permease n=1 Tax=uncultured Paludibaculum sp. TaxID=1765020 RepID=UPI002AAB8519|nr:ABC transporter permease [uncultured Paludibaculum sp.]